LWEERGRCCVRVVSRVGRRDRLLSNILFIANLQCCHVLIAFVCLTSTPSLLIPLSIRVLLHPSWDYRRYRCEEIDKMGSAELPKKYKAIVYDKPGSISTKIEELDMPEPGPGEVLINLYVASFSALLHFILHARPVSTTLAILQHADQSSAPIQVSATPTWAS